MQRQHVLKTIDSYWDSVASGEKTFEVRRDDRGFQKGDLLHLVRYSKEYSPCQIRLEVKYSERGEHFCDGTRVDPATVLTVTVKYVLTGGQFGIHGGYVVMAIERVRED